jgi:AraC family transcriptional regulator
MGAPELTVAGGPPTGRWFAGLPQAAVRSSASLGWDRLEAHRFDGLRCADFTLPPVEQHFISAHLLRPCQVDTHWSGRHHHGRSLPGNLMLMAAGQDSVWNCSAAMDELHVFVHPSVVEEVAAEIGVPRFELIDGIGLVDPTLAEMARQILAEIERPGIGTRIFAESMARSLALHLLRHHSTAASSEAPPRIEITVRQLRAATDYIECHLEEDLTLERIAAATAMSPFRFARAFKKKTGQSPRQYVIARRIELAKELLRAGDFEIAEIANRVGLSTQSHFTSVFRKLCGTTPKRFRDLHRV